MKLDPSAANLDAWPTWLADYETDTPMAPIPLAGAIYSELEAKDQHNPAIRDIGHLIREVENWQRQSTPIGQHTQRLGGDQPCPVSNSQITEALLDKLDDLLLGLFGPGNLADPNTQRADIQARIFAGLKALDNEQDPEDAAD